MRSPFHGAKIALMHDGHILVYLRDDKPTIPYPNAWDLPGGGAEGDETPLECAQRELREEFTIALPSDRVRWAREYPSERAGRPPTWFFVADLEAGEIQSIAFGDEGQHWQMMPVETYLAHSQAVAHLQERLCHYFATLT